MRLRLVVKFVALLVASHGARSAGVESCSEMLVEAPGSVEARVCFAREMTVLNGRITEVTAAIEAEVLKGHSAFKLEDLRNSQRKWRQFVESTCWLDAAGAANTDAVFQHCTSRYTLQRLSQLQGLHKGLIGETIMWPMSNLAVPQ
jgi:uncharacterized protein YecT (DUF1311 family)